MSRVTSIIIFVLMFVFAAYGSEVQMEIQTGPLKSAQATYGTAAKVSNFKPVVGEPFRVDFLVSFSGEVTPDFPSFKPHGLEVVERLKTRNKVTIKNGVQIRQTVYRYSMVAERVGTAYLKKIKISVAGKDYKTSSKSIPVVKTRPKPKLVFLEAVPSKGEVFPGEGFDINYYRYVRQHSIQVGFAQEKKTPSFKNIIKRVRGLKREEPFEFESINGIPYGKQKVYSVRAYAEAPGKVSIGPMKVEFEYRRGSFSNRRVKTLSSKRVEVSVKDLPEPMPNNYTGLVGKHEFILTPPRSRFVVNEPIELTLEVVGNGALEKVELPALIDDPNIESFDSQSEVQLDHGKSGGRIKYNFTYLARSPLTLPPRTIRLSTLNPDSGKFEEHTVEMPEIVVGGAAVSSQKSLSGSSDEKSDEQVQEPVKKTISNKALIGKMLAPDFSPKSERRNWFLIINSLLAVIALIIWLSIWIRRPKVYSVDPKVQRLIDSMKKSGVTYSQLHHLLLYLNDNLPLVDISLGELISDSSLSDDGKEYFSNIIAMTEKQNYGDELDVDIDFNPKYFKEVVELLKK